MDKSNVDVRPLNALYLCVAAVVSCADRPCMNDGQCIQGGEGEGASPFIHFHCKCVHPYKGILCDVSCDTDSKFNFQLLCFT